MSKMMKIGSSYEKLLRLHNTYLAYKKKYRNNKHLNEGLVAYTDGSSRGGISSYGCVLLLDGGIKAELWGAEENFLWQEHGSLYAELLGVMNAIMWAKENGYLSLLILTDRCEAGRLGNDKKIRCLVLEQYKEFIKGCGVKLRFQKVISHSGVVLHNLADKLTYMAFVEFLIKKELCVDVESIREAMEDILISMTGKKVKKTDKFWYDLSEEFREQLVSGLLEAAR
jgi:ribonuclease HI